MLFDFSISTSSLPSMSISSSIIGFTHLVCFLGIRLVIAEQLLERCLSLLQFLVLLRTWPMVGSSQPRFSCTGASPWLVIPSSWLMRESLWHCHLSIEILTAVSRSPVSIIVSSPGIVQRHCTQVIHACSLRLGDPHDYSYSFFVFCKERKNE